MTPSIGVNLGRCSFYEPTGLLYADCFRVAQNFYGGADALGNPTVPGQKIIVWQNLSAAAGAGVYQFIATGKCSLALGPTTVPGVTISAPAYDAGKNQTTQTVTVPSANWPAVSQLGLQVNWNAGDAPPTNVQLWRPGANVGDLFYAPFLKLLAPFSTIRFMDTLGINNSTLADFSKRPTPDQRNFQNGIPLEHALALCQQLGKDFWLNLHFLIAADPVQRKAFAAWLAKNVPIGSPIAAYIEPTNEDWNSMFLQWKQTQTAAAQDPAVHYDGMGDTNILGWREFAEISAMLSQDIQAAYGVNDWRKTPIRPLLCDQWGNPAAGQYSLKYVNDRMGPPASFFWGYSFAEYWTVDWSKGPKTPDDFNNDLQADLPAGTLSQQNWALARQYGLHRVVYEAGPDMGQDPANSAQRDQATALASAGVAMSNGLASCLQGGAELVMVYQACYQNQQSGDWGLVQDPLNLNTPKYQAVLPAAKFSYFDPTPLPIPATPQPTPTPAPAQTPPLFSGSFKGSDGKTTYTVTVNQQ